MSHRPIAESPGSRRPRWGALFGTAVLAAIVLVAGLISDGVPGRAGRTAKLIAQPVPTPVPSARRAVDTSAPPRATTSTVPLAPASATADENSPPVRVTIPAIGVDSTLQSLGLLSDGTLQPPSSYQQAGWYAKGVVPGSTGPAVIAGHVDSTAGPGVFFRLRDLRVGDLVQVKNKAGRTLSFVIDDVHAYPKAQFPTAAVYGPTSLPELRLITCTGDFDTAARSYLSNLVVSAHLA